MTKSVLFAVTASLLAVGCGPNHRGDDGAGDDSTVDGGGPGSNPGSGSDNPQAQECNKMDIVFVVDDSGSMAEEQTNLATNFPMFATLLQNYTNADGDHVDFRIAVTTTGKSIDYTISLGMGFPDLPMSESDVDGVFQNNCGPSERWLDSSDTTDLGCRANVGTSGASIEMPMLMADHSLTEQAGGGGPNAGFLRDDALLAVVMLTDEDDQSVTGNNFTVGVDGIPPIDYQPADLIHTLDTLKGDRSRWAAAVIAGDGDCSSSFGDAVNAARLKDFVNQANSGSTQAVFSSICDGDLSIGLQKALDTFQAACGQIIL
jgi:hypothetical protein